MSLCGGCGFPIDDATLTCECVIRHYIGDPEYLELPEPPVRDPDGDDDDLDDFDWEDDE